LTLAARSGTAWTPVATRALPDYAVAFPLSATVDGLGNPIVAWRGLRVCQRPSPGSASSRADPCRSASASTSTGCRMEAHPPPPPPPPPPPANLVSNPGFESAGIPSGHSGGSLSQATAAARSGAYGLAHRVIHQGRLGLRRRRVLACAARAAEDVQRRDLSPLERNGDRRAQRRPARSQPPLSAQRKIRNPCRPRWRRRRAPGR
jgi:hypothetical protein